MKTPATREQGRETLLLIHHLEKQHLIKLNYTKILAFAIFDRPG
jgi:hypothetical protein